MGQIHPLGAKHRVARAVLNGILGVQAKHLIYAVFCAALRAKNKPHVNPIGDAPRYGCTNSSEATEAPSTYSTPSTPASKGGGPTNSHRG
eukprot:7768800-Pyramimonas_sp.AAC.1